MLFLLFEFHDANAHPEHEIRCAELGYFIFLCVAQREIMQQYFIPQNRFMSFIFKQK